MDALYRDALPENCPPPEAREQRLTLYRIIENETPTERDFLSHVKKNPKIKYEELCIPSGLSLFDSIKNATLANEASIKRRRIPIGHFIAKVEVTEDLGKLSNRNSNGHYTFWPYRVFTLSSFFEVTPLT